MKWYFLLVVVIFGAFFITGCPPSQICGDGYCSAEEDAMDYCPQDCNLEPIPECYDSDDSDTRAGWNSWDNPGDVSIIDSDNYKKGYIEGVDLNAIEISNDYSKKKYYDSCMDSNGIYAGKLDERYCYDNNQRMGSRLIECPNGCKDGACVKNNDLPDLIIKDIVVEYNDMRGWPGYDYTVYVKNIGNAPASISRLNTVIDPKQPQRIVTGEPNDFIWSSSSNAPVPGDSNELINPGETKKYSDYFNPSEEGYITLTAKADHSNQIEESNEDNNVMQKTFYVKNVFDIKPKPCPQPAKPECPTGSTSASYVNNDGCQSWRCVPNPTVTCADSDGFDAYVLGKITGTDADGNSFTISDTCGTTTNLIERVCEGQTGAIIRIPCANGCQAGRCSQ